MIETTISRCADPVRLSAYFQRCEKSGAVYLVTDESTGIQAGLISLAKLQWLESRSAELRAHEVAATTRLRIPRSKEKPTNEAKKLAGLTD